MIYRGKYLVKCYTPDEFYAVKEALNPIIGEGWLPFSKSTLEGIIDEAWGRDYKKYSCARCFRINFDANWVGWDLEINYEPGHTCNDLIVGHKIVNASEFMNDVFGVDISGRIGIDIDVESYI